MGVLSTLSAKDATRGLAVVYKHWRPTVLNTQRVVLGRWFAYSGVRAGWETERFEGCAGRVSSTICACRWCRGEGTWWLGATAGPYPLVPQNQRKSYRQRRGHPAVAFLRFTLHLLHIPCHISGTAQKCDTGVSISERRGRVLEKVLRF